MAVKKWKCIKDCELTKVEQMGRNAIVQFVDDDGSLHNMDLETDVKPNFEEIM